MIESFSRTLDLLKFTRRAGFFTTLWITVYATTWSLGFPAEAMQIGYSASEVAMIIGAVMAPISMLQGFVINAYYSKGTHNVIPNAQHKVHSPSSDNGIGSSRGV